MAFGDIVQSDAGGSADAITLPGPVTAGNSIVLVGHFRTYEGGAPTSVSDDVNAGNYSLAFAAGNGDTVQDNPQCSLYFLPDVSSGSPVLTTADAAPAFWVLAEIEGAIADASVGATGFSATQVASVTTGSDTIPANSVSFAAAKFQFASRSLVPAGWSAEASSVTLRFLSRQDASSTTGDYSGSISGGNSTYAAGWASFTEAGGPAGPSLGSVPATAFPGQSRTVAVTGAGATQGTGGITIGGVTQTITAWSDTSVTFTTVLGNNSYGTGKVVELTTDAGGTDTGTIELVADTASGFGVVTMSEPNTTDESSVAFSATPTVVTGDQFEWEDFNDLGGLAIDAAGFVSAVDEEGVFRGRFWDASDGTWGSVNTFTAQVEDETAPTIESASVPTAGDNIAVQIDEPMQVGAGGPGGWTIGLGDATISSAAVDGTDDTIINLTPSRTITDEDTFTIGYTQPGDGFQDQADTPNDLATLSGQAVTNNSTQEPPDVTGPVTESVDVPADGTYAIGDDLSFTVNWDEAVTVTGAPALNLDIGGSSRQANYVSGSGTAALVFTYTVQEGDEDADGIAVSSLTLDGGTLQDSSANNATLTVNSVGDTSGVLVDGIRPVISINALTTTDTTPIASGSAGDATSLTLVVNSVTYNPTPSGGTWSQQLPELALDTYPMTLNGEDANGNAAVEAVAVLSVVDEIIDDALSAFRRPIRQSIRQSIRRSIAQ